MPTKLVLFCTKEPPPMGLKQLMLNKCEFIKQGTSSLLILFFLQILWNSVRNLDSRLSPTHSYSSVPLGTHEKFLPVRHISHEQRGGSRKSQPSSFFYSSSSSSIKNSHSFSNQGALRRLVAMVTSFILKTRRPEPLNLQNRGGMGAAAAPWGLSDSAGGGEDAGK